MGVSLALISIREMANGSRQWKRKTWNLVILLLMGRRQGLQSCLREREGRLRGQQQGLFKMVKRVDKKICKRKVAHRKRAEKWKNVKGEAILGEVHMELLIR